MKIKTFSEILDENKTINAATILPFIKEYHNKYEKSKDQMKKSENNCFEKTINKLPIYNSHKLLSLKINKANFSFKNPRKNITTKIISTEGPKTKSQLNNDSLVEINANMRKKIINTEPNNEIIFNNIELVSKIRKSFYQNQIEFNNLFKIKSPKFIDLFDLTKKNLYKQSRNIYFNHNLNTNY